MSENKLIHIRGNTWCLPLRGTIPFYFLNDKEVVLFDTAYPTDRPALMELLEREQLHVRAILGSHAHYDHIGSHAHLQKEQGTEIIMHRSEALLLADPLVLTSIYAPAPPQDLRRVFEGLLLEADRTFTYEDRVLEIDGVPFEVVPLPGHTPGHTGFVTPDDVLFLGDTLLDEDFLSMTKVPTALDWELDLASKEFLRNTRHAAYVMCHSGFRYEIEPLARMNIEEKKPRLERIAGWIREAGPLSLSDVEQLLYKNLNVHTHGPKLTQFVFQRNTRCMMEYLVHTGMLQRELRDGTCFFL